MTSTATLPSFNVDGTIGALLICTLGNLALLTGLCDACLKYARDFGRRDPIGIRFCIALGFLTALTSSACSCAVSYMFTVSHWGDPAILSILPSNAGFVGKLNFLPSVTAGVIFTTGFSSCILQSFLIYRVYKLAPSVLFCILVIPVLGGLALLPMAGSLICTIRGTGFEVRLVKIGMHLWFIGSAVSDVAITSCMLYCFHMLQRQYPGCQLNLHRFMIRALASGLVCCIWSLATLIVWRVTYDLATIAFFAPTSSICGLTLVSNLSFREADPTLWTEAEERSHRVIQYQARPLNHALINEKASGDESSTKFSSSTKSESITDQTASIPSTHESGIKHKLSAGNSDSPNREPSVFDQINIHTVTETV